MNRERLKELARDILPYVPTKRFNMALWLRNGRCHCGTAACAFGWHAASKQGKAQGLGLMPMFNGYMCPTIDDGHGDELSGFDAAKTFYDIPEDVADWLFDPMSYLRSHPHGFVYQPIDITPAMVAERIETLLAADTD